MDFLGTLSQSKNVATSKIILCTIIDIERKLFKMQDAANSFFFNKCVQTESWSIA